MRKIFLTALGLLTCTLFTQAQVFLEEDFDACGLPAGWTNEATDSTFVWDFTAASSDPSNAGNLDGTCMALFDDDALGSTASNVGATLTSPIIDLSGATGTVLLDFDYNYRALSGSSFTVEVFNGFGFDTVLNLTSLSDCGAWSCGPPYPKASIDVSGAANALFFVRFTYRDGGSFAWWAAFDNVQVRQLVDQDVAAIDLLEPTSACGLGGNEPVTAIVENVGGDTVNAISMGLTVDGSLVSTEAWSVVLPPFSTDTFTFSATANLAALGPHTVAVSANASPTDGDPSNATVTETVTNIVPITSFPYITDFDNWATCSTATSCATLCDAEEDWVNDSDDDADWRTNSGTTTSTATGPSGDNTTGSGNYMYIETSINCGTSILTSTCFDVTGLTNPTIQLFYHMYGSEIGTLQVEISDDNGLTWDSLWSQTGQVQTANADPFALIDIDISAYVGSVLKMRVVGIQDGTFNGDIAIDDVKIFDKPANDAQAVSVNNLPVDDCDLSSAVSISGTIRNNGISDIFNFPVSYSINGGAPVAEVFTDTLAPGATGDYTFATAADLSADGVYSVAVSVALAGDGDPSNDTAVDTVVNIVPITSFPYTQDFDDWATCSTISTCTTIICDAEDDWVNTGGDGDDWRTDANGTGSINTGPSQDNTQDSTAASQNYMYIESSGTCGPAFLESPCFDITGLAIPGVEFFYHMYGADIDTLEVQVSDDNGATWDVLLTLVGQQAQTDELDPWTKQLVPLTGYSGVLKIRFKGTNKTGTSGDIAIDDVSFLDLPPAGDLEIVEVLSPVGDACSFSSAEVVSAVIRNAGAVPLSGFNYGYKVNAGASIVQNYGAAVLNPLDIDTVTFATPANLSASGSYLITVVGVLVGDSDNSNDTAFATVNNLVPIAAFPYLETFDEWTVCATTSTCTTVCDAENGWANNSDDQGDWRTDAGGTPSSLTGPSADHTQDTAAVSQNYLYVEGTASSCFDPKIITSPCFDISALTLPGVQFWYHMHGDDIGTLSVEASDDNGGTWTEIYSRSGEDQTASTDPWKQVTLGLDGFAGVIQVRFVYFYSTTFNADCAIDDISVLDLPAFEDVAATALEPVGDNCELSATQPVTISLQGLGSVPSTGFDVAYSINGGTPVVENVGALVLAPLADTTYTFSTTADLSVDGDYEITAWAAVAGDVNNLNDTVSVSITNQTAISVLPFVEDFESYADGNSTFNEWVNTTTSLEQWEAEAGNTSSTGTGPIGPNSGLLYAYIEASGAIAGDIATLASPCIDLSGAANPRLNFFYHMYGDAIGGLYVTADAGAGIDTIFSVIGQQDTSETDDWNQALVDLTAYIGQTVKLNIIGQVADPIPSGVSSFESDIAIDDIIVEDPVDNDAATVAILNPSTGCGLTSTETVSAVVQNFGLLTATSVQMRFRVNGGPFTTEAWSTSIPSGGVDTFTFAGTADLSAVGDYNILVSATSLGDSNPANDTLTTSVTAEDGIALPFTEDFESYGEFVTSFTDWSNTTSALENWETEAGNTPTANTGPDDAAEGSIYAYIESSGALVGDIATLTSPCVNLAGTTAPRLFFNYHMWGAGIGGLFVTVESSGGSAVDTLLALVGEQDTAGSFIDPWNAANVDLTAYVGQRVTLNIIGRVDTTNGLSDIAIDNIVVDDPVAIDAGVVGYLSPADGCGLGADTVVALVKNFGLNTITQVQMRYQINGGPLTSENWLTSLEPFETDTFTFSVLGDFSATGANDLLISGAAVGDLNAANDAQNFTVNNGIVPGFLIDFDDLEEAVTDFGNAISNLGPEIDWETEAGPTPSTGVSTGPDDDASGGGLYIYMETSLPVDTGDKATLQLECVSVPVDGASLTYAYHMFGDAIGQLEVAVLTATDTTDLNVIVGQQQTDGADPWLRDTIDLGLYAGQTVAIRFTGVASNEPGNTTSFTGDIALDEIGILAAPAPVCNSANVPTNQAHVNEATRVRLTWDPQPGAVACQVKGKRVTPPGPTPSVNILTPPINTTNVPYAAAGAGTEWAWQVRCACSITPLDVSAFTGLDDTFSIPLAREADLVNLEMDLFPNPASQLLTLQVQADKAAEYDLLITDLVGRVSESRRVNLVEGYNTIQFNVEGFAEGVYFLQIGNAQSVPFEVLR